MLKTWMTRMKPAAYITKKALNRRLLLIHGANEGMLSKGCLRNSTSAPTLSQSAVLAFFRPLLRTGLFWFCTHRVAYLRHWRPISRIRLIEDRIPVDRFVLQFLKQKRAVKALVIGRRFYTAPFCADRFTWNSLPLSLSPILAFFNRMSMFLLRFILRQNCIRIAQKKKAPKSLLFALKIYFCIRELRTLILFHVFNAQSISGKLFIHRCLYFLIVVSGSFQFLLAHRTIPIVSTNDRINDRIRHLLF